MMITASHWSSSTSLGRCCWSPACCCPCKPFVATSVDGFGTGRRQHFVDLALSAAKLRSSSTASFDLGPHGAAGSRLQSCQNCLWKCHLLNASFIDCSNANLMCQPSFWQSWTIEGGPPMLCWLSICLRLGCRRHCLLVDSRRASRARFPGGSSLRRRLLQLWTSYCCSWSFLASAISLSRERCCWDRLPCACLLAAGRSY